ncbi:MAG: hypothetical protein GY847_31315 [Proteobacteria bacterium]|nr:hypothetical protein [Pseudomonadota bacterium]
MSRDQICFSQGEVSAKDSAENMLVRLGNSENPGALVKALAPHDLLVAWGIADDEQRAELLQLADKEQADLLVDLSCWPSDRPDLDKLEELVRPLTLSRLGGAVHVLGALDSELKTLLLRRNAKIHLLENRNDEISTPESSELIPCPDGFYFIEFPDPDRVSDVERALFGALLSQPFEQYQLELECIRHDMQSELQETALRWRTGRLADFGFASRDTAISILAPRSANEVRLLAEQTEIKSVPLISNISLPVLYRENLKGNDFLDRVLEILEGSNEPIIERRVSYLGAELAVMTSRFLTAIATDISDLDEVAQNTTWARDLLSLGLAKTARGNIEHGVRLLSALAPVLFLQVGLGLVYRLRDRARFVLGDKRLASDGRPGAIFDPPHQLALTCLARDIPCCWPMNNRDDGLRTDLFIPHSSELTAFSRQDEIDTAEMFLSESEQLHSLLFDTFECDVPLPEETPSSMIVLTALVNASRGLDPRPFPVTFSNAENFCRQVLSQDENRFATDALAVLAPLFGAQPVGPTVPDDEPDPKRRLLLRLVLIGRARLKPDHTEQAVLLEPVQ